MIFAVHQKIPTCVLTPRPCPNCTGRLANAEQSLRLFLLSLSLLDALMNLELRFRNVCNVCDHKKAADSNEAAYINVRRRLLTEFTPFPWRAMLFNKEMLRAPRRRRAFLLRVLARLCSRAARIRAHVRVKLSSLSLYVRLSASHVRASV